MHCFHSMWQACHLWHPSDPLDNCGATKELPNFLPYAAVDSTDALEDRCARFDLAALGRLVVCDIAVILKTLAFMFLPEPIIASSNLLLLVMMSCILL